MGTTISFGIQKGGVGKTSSAAIVAWMLAKKGFKVLVGDMDAQGNATAFLTQRDIYDFTNKTILEAIQTGDPRPYIVPVAENLDLLPSEDRLAWLPEYVYLQYLPKHKEAKQSGEYARLLKRALEVVKDDYDYIILDLPPNPALPTQMALAASDWAVIVYETGKWCYDALGRYMEIIDFNCAQYGSDIRIAGILPTMISAVGVDEYYLGLAREDYGAMVFDSVVKRRTKIKEYAAAGLPEKQLKDDRDVLEMYSIFLEELMARVGTGK